MKTADIINIRFQNQHLTSPLTKIVDVVASLGAVQAQDYPGAKWAVGMRCENITDDDIYVAFTHGEILRTHVMRPTWHFVAPKDIRWLLKLTAPRVHQVSAYYYRKAELDDLLFKKSQKILIKALQGGKQLTRPELVAKLQESGIPSVQNDNLLRFSYIMIQAELEGIICSGGKRDKQFTYALLEERVPKTKELDRDEALAELTLRYFTSHGPALVKDFTWWSGLPAVDAKRGLEMNKSALIEEVINGKQYWLAPVKSVIKIPSPTAYLLSNYDEYVIGYSNHDEIFDPEYRDKLQLVFAHSIMIDGKIVGAWKREFKKDGVIVSTKFFRELSNIEKDALKQAVDRYRKFLKPIEIVKSF